jgi:hypothetical protein
MVEIIPEMPSFSSRLGAALGSGFGAGIGNIAERLSGKRRLAREDEALQRMGLDLSGITDPELRKSIVTQSLRQKTDKEAEKIQLLQGIKGTINEIRNVAEGPGIGLFEQYKPTSEAFYNRAKLKTLSSDMLTFYKSLFPRGITQEEFKRFEKDYLPKPSDTHASIQGKLDAFEDLINRKIGSFEEPEAKGSKKSSKVKFDLSNPEHKAKRDQLLKTYKNDREKVKEILSREFEE